MSASADNQELAYALVTPYSLHKSRTGGILARLLWADVELVAARMYAPRPDSPFIQEYCDAIYDPDERHVPLHYQKLIIEYVIKNFGRPNVRGISNRLTLLVFRGANAVRQIAEAVGHLSEHVRGDNVRGTYGDFFHEDADRLWEDPAFEHARRLLDRYEALKRLGPTRRENAFFEPAVLTGVTPELTEAHLKLFRKYAYTDGGFVADAVEGLSGPDVETTLVVLKPESFRNRDPMPGNLIDFFARTGMFITGMKVFQLTVEEARQFYSLKLDQFREQLKGMVADRARQAVERARVLAREAVRQMGADPALAYEPARALALARAAERLMPALQRPGEVKPAVAERVYEELAARLTSLEPPPALYDQVAEDLKDENARAEFDELIAYMTGCDPRTGRPREEGGPAKCMALLYSGPRALTVIRERLRELRRIYGRDILQNRAHASDPDEDPLKEVRVVGMPNAPEGEKRPCDVEEVVNEFYGPEG